MRLAVVYDGGYGSSWHGVIRPASLLPANAHGLGRRDTVFILSMARCDHVCQMDRTCQHATPNPSPRSFPTLKPLHVVSKNLSGLP